LTHLGSVRCSGERSLPFSVSSGVFLIQTIEKLTIADFTVVLQHVVVGGDGGCVSTCGECMGAWWAVGVMLSLISAVCGGGGGGGGDRGGGLVAGGGRHAVRA